jgi:hypothetical protein
MKEDKAGKVRFKPGPVKGMAPVLPDIGLTRLELALKVGHELVSKGVEPTLRNIAAEEPRLSLGFLNANSKSLGPCRDAYGRAQNTPNPTVRRAGASKNEANDSENIIALAERRAERAIQELKQERAAHEETKRALRDERRLNARLLKGYADELLRSEMG